MKALFILRHAKSSWKDSSLADFDRPLNARGRKAASLIGQFIGRQGIEPDVVLSSPAVRARETIEIVRDSAALRVDIGYDERVYEASAASLLEVISRIEDKNDTALLVGHNPGMGDLVQVLTGRAEHMPAAALAKVTLEARKWSEVLGTRGRLEWLARPRELAAG